MESSAAIAEREHFSKRLVATLVNAGCTVSPAGFVMEYNLRANGAAVTVYAARKWLAGSAIPTQEKVKILAQWLGVSAAWLRFGMPENLPFKSDPLGLGQSDRRLLSDIHLLKERDRVIVLELVKALLRNPA